MKRIFLLLVAIVSCGFGHGGAPGQTAKNIVTDYSATCNGVADDTTAWNAFVTANQGGNIVLTIPRGSVCCFTSTSVELSYGLANLRVIGYGATITNQCNGTIGQVYYTGGGGGTPHPGGIYQDNSHSSLIATVAAGASSVTLLTPAETSRFTVGQWALLTGGDLMGNGYPPNPWSHDWVLVTAKDGACTGTGTVCFHDPIQNLYKSTWPSYSANTWQGGPATLYAISPGWGGVVEYRGITFILKNPADGTDATSTCNGRVCRFIDVTMNATGPNCPFPSQNWSYVYQNVSMPNCGMEIDKIVDQVLIERSNVARQHIQSASVNQFLMTGSTSTDINGTPVTAIISFSTISNLLQLGASSFGVSKSVILNGDTIATIQDIGANQANVDSAFTMSGGVMSQTIIAGTAPNWASPGGSYIFNNGATSPVSVMDLSASGGTLNVTTNLAGGYPIAGPMSITAVPVTRTVH